MARRENERQSLVGLLKGDADGGADFDAAAARVWAPSPQVNGRPVGRDSVEEGIDAMIGDAVETIDLRFEARRGGKPGYDAQRALAERRRVAAGMEPVTPRRPSDGKAQKIRDAWKKALLAADGEERLELEEAYERKLRARGAAAWEIDLLTEASEELTTELYGGGADETPVDLADFGIDDDDGEEWDA